MELPNLRILRLSRNFSQENLAEELGISRRQYGRLERGECPMDIERLGAIGKILRTSIGQLSATLISLPDTDV